MKSLKKIFWKKLHAVKSQLSVWCVSKIAGARYSRACAWLVSSFRWKELGSITFSCCASPTNPLALYYLYSFFQISLALCLYALDISFSTVGVTFLWTEYWYSWNFGFAVLYGQPERPRSRPEARHIRPETGRVLGSSFQGPNLLPHTEMWVSLFTIDWQAHTRNLHKFTQAVEQLPICCLSEIQAISCSIFSALRCIEPSFYDLVLQMISSPSRSQTRPKRMLPWDRTEMCRWVQSFWNRIHG